MSNRRKGTPTAPKEPGQTTDLMKANLNLLTGEHQIVLLSGYYNNRPAVHLAVVIKDGESFLVFPIARMYTEQDMKKIGDPDNKKTDSLKEKEVVRTGFYEFEYDLNYSGGDYHSVGETVKVPMELVDRLGAPNAFHSHTGIDPIHIIHFGEAEDGQDGINED